MGMFDYIKCEYPLPDGFVMEEGQTKDFDCEMVTHRITREGRLMLTRVDRTELVPKAERAYPDAPDDDIRSMFGAIRTHTSEHDANFHGLVNFYGGPAADWKAWREFNAKFTDGQLVEIVEDKDG